MQTKPEAHGERRLSDDDFRLRVLLADAGYHLASRCRVDDVGR
jgi:hypothetical protein